jgi:hypothetical protein
MARRLMTLRHATPRQRLESICREGLRVAYAQGEKTAIWLHTPSKTPWAVTHTQARHQVELHDVVILTVSVPRAALTRFRSGLWYTGEDIPAERLWPMWDGGNRDGC